MSTLLYLLFLVSVAHNGDALIRRKLIESSYYSSPLNFLKLPLTYRKGTLGVNFLGFHATAGLFGGLLAETAGLGGPHAEASTPFGQSAGAGIGVRSKLGSNYAYLYCYSQLGKSKAGMVLLGGMDKGRWKVKLQSIEDVEVGKFL
ncbi:hypothetical protein TcasGA2_TC034660 [Tribolium castaneum]|uniref:Uncharacterized protein n=1 Tax=Tribolium castaneum TaxID=7070 RepID=A0A139WJB1_TRICA|nr:PREDICTED: uncharacterized protein LOC103312723 [Tribolium castaneum]KYB28039.1 hypothetical protein TcasGA2_TC034660 [Tribolium castaneum]|eukprot:XP_008192332.1 PREDICTED: uncharacterized protein LOC103312723 [Tribolium castaneum]